ncbi:hypothetical protein HYT58_02585 [Candidatus Woesearchaeota archaeon]|nr:hypothetical protein [Candidatus Woesearchaeota archaeon]
MADLILEFRVLNLSNKWMFKNVKNGYVTLLPNSGEEESISMDLDVGGTAKYQDIDRFSSSLTAENKNEEFSSISTHIKDGRRIIETNGFVNTALYGHIDGTAGDIQSNNKDGSTIIHVDGNKISSFILQGDSSFSRYGSRTEPYIPAQIVPRGGTSLAYILDKDSTLSISELKGNMVDEIYPLGGVVKETKEGLLMDGEYNIFYPVGQTRKLNIIKTEKSLFPEITMNRAAVTDQPDVPLPVFDIEDTRSGTKIENTHENGIMVKVKAPETQSSVQVLAPKLDPMLSDFDALIPDVSNGAGEGDDTKEDIDYKQAHIDIANSLQAASRELKDIESNNASESQKLTMLQKLQKQTQNIVNQCKAHKVICGGIIILAIFLLYRIKKSMEKKGYEFRSPVQLRSPITKEES